MSLTKVCLTSRYSTFPFLLKLCVVPNQSVPSRHSQPEISTHCCGFFHHILVLAILKLHIQWKHTVCTLFVPSFLLSLCFCDSFILSIHNLFLLCNIISLNHNAFIHLPLNGHLDCFQFLTIVNKAAVNIHMFLL